MDKIICNKCGYSQNIDDIFLRRINTYINGINYENINSILPKLKCTACGSKDFRITPIEQSKDYETKPVYCSKCKKEIDQKDVNPEQETQVCADCANILNLLQNNSTSKKSKYTNKYALYLSKKLCKNCQREIEKERLVKNNCIELCSICTKNEKEEHDRKLIHQNSDDKYVSEINKDSTDSNWDYGVDESEKIIPFSSLQQHSGKTSIDKYRKGH
jgi:hypothetical protein